MNKIKLDAGVCPECGGEIVMVEREIDGERIVSAVVKCGECATSYDWHQGVYTPSDSGIKSHLRTKGIGSVTLLSEITGENTGTLRSWYNIRRKAFDYMVAGIIAEIGGRSCR